MGAGLPASNAEVLVEAKWANSSHCSEEAIFQDFLRLAILKKCDPKAACIFVLAGTHAAIGAALLKMPFKSAPSYQDGIGYSGYERKLTFDRSNLRHMKWFAPSISEFIRAGFDIPDSFVTRSNGLHPIQSPSGTIDFQCIAWELVSISTKKLNAKVWG